MKHIVYVADVGLVSIESACAIVRDWESTLEDLWEREAFVPHQHLWLRLSSLRKQLKSIRRSRAHFTRSELRAFYSVDELGIE